MKRGKRVKPVFPIEYRLLITRLFKENEKTYATSLALRTTNEFSHFRYEIIVESELIDRTIRLSIRGLRAPELSIPGNGPAIYKTEYSNLSGQYDLVIIKPGKEENLFSITITKKQVLIENNPKNKFIEVVTTPDEW